MSDAPARDAVPAVGDLVRLAGGASVRVSGVRRTAESIWLLPEGGDWFDGAGAEVLVEDPPA